MYSDTLWPGSWPPSPGLAPCAILIWIWSADDRYSAVTPKRPDATCLILRAQAVARLQRDVDFDAVAAEDGRERIALAHGALAGAQFDAIARLVLAAFAGVRLAADAVHRDRERRVRFGRDRAEAHRAGREALDDLLRGLDFLDRHRRALGRLELEQAAERLQLAALLVDELRVVAIRRVRVRRASRAAAWRSTPASTCAPRRARGTCTRRPGRACRAASGSSPNASCVQARRLLGDLEHADALDVARRAGEVLVDERLLQPDRLEDLRAAVGLVRRDAHLGHHLVEALADRLDEALARLLEIDAGHRFGELARASRARDTDGSLRRRSLRAARSHAPRAPSRSRRRGPSTCAGPSSPDARARRRSRAAPESAAARATRCDRTG